MRSLSCKRSGLSAAGDVLLADRGFCNWALLAQCVQRDLQAVFRVKGSVRGDFRRGQRLSRDERLVRWRKPRERAWTLSPQQWLNYPKPDLAAGSLPAALGGISHAAGAAW